MLKVTKRVIVCDCWETLTLSVLSIALVKRWAPSGLRLIPAGGRPYVTDDQNRQVQLLCAPNAPHTAENLEAYDGDHPGTKSD
jgi:hypothetical protein